MIKLWLPFRKKTAEKPKNVRIDCEDLIEQGYTCKEISAELGITEEEVYRIKSAKQRRMATIQNRTPEEDRISKLKEELATIELQDKIDECRHRAHLRELFRSDELSEDIEEVSETAENPDKLIQTLLATFLLKGQSGQSLNTPAPIQNNSSQPAGEVFTTQNGNSQQTPTFSSQAGLDFSKIETAIKTGIVTEERFIKEAEALNLNPDKSKKLFKFIKEKL